MRIHTMLAIHTLKYYLGHKNIIVESSNDHAYKQLLFSKEDYCCFLNQSI